MATKDVGKGWGNLPGSLTEWKCPPCAVAYPVADWAIVWKDLNGVNCDGRKCPVCDFAAYQHHETNAMDTVVRVAIPTPVEAKKKRSHRKHG